MGVAGLINGGTPSIQPNVLCCRLGKKVPYLCPMVCLVRIRHKDRIDAVSSNSRKSMGCYDLEPIKKTRHRIWWVAVGMWLGIYFGHVIYLYLFI